MSMPGNADGVIHNIGYRRYEGARLPNFDIVKALFSQTLRGSFGMGRGVGAKIFPWFLVGCTILPAFIIVAVQTQVGGVIVATTDYTVFVQMVPALFLAVQAPQAVSRDLRFHTLPLYFSRQLLPREYVMAKFAGVWTGLMMLLVAPLILLYVGALLVHDPFGTATLHFAEAVFGVALFALLLTGIGLLIGSVTPRRGLGVAAIIAVIAGSYGAASMMQGILAFSGSEAGATVAALLSPMTIYQVAQSGLFGIHSDGLIVEPGLATGIAFTLLLLAITWLCYWLLNLRYRKVASS